jgi:hypothetical protein
MRNPSCTLLIVALLSCSGDQRRETETGRVEPPAAPAPPTGAVGDFLEWEERWIAGEPDSAPSTIDEGAELPEGLRRMASALQALATNGGYVIAAYGEPVEAVRRAARELEDPAIRGREAGAVKGACTAAAGLLEDIAVVLRAERGIAADAVDAAHALPQDGPLEPRDPRAAACVARVAEAIDELAGARSVPDEPPGRGSRSTPAGAAT